MSKKSYQPLFLQTIIYFMFLSFFILLSLLFNSNSFASNADIIICDLNNDRKKDIIQKDSTGNIQYTLDLTNWVQITGNLPRYIACGDLNGDGTDDIIGIDANGFIKYTLDRGNSWQNIAGALEKIFLADINGDSKYDIIGLNANKNIYITYNLQSWTPIQGTLDYVQPGNFNPSRMGNELAGLNDKGYIYYTTDMFNWINIPGVLALLFSGEINMDGKWDLIGLNAKGEIYYTINLITWINIPGLLSYIVTGDVNGDGRNDIIGLNAQNQIWYTTNLSTWQNIAGALIILATGDLNGDGKSDIVGIGTDGNVYYSLDLINWIPIRETQGEFSYITGTGYYIAPNISMPQKGISYKDQNFNSNIKRLTDKTVDNYKGPGIQNEYSKADPENSDGTMVILRSNNAHYYIYNPLTNNIIREITAFDECNQEPEPRWDSINPNIFYYLCKTELRSYNTSTNTSTTLHNFKNDFPQSYLITTKVEGDASLDRRYWCLMVENSSSKLISVIVYDRVSDRILGQKSTGFPDDINWVGMSMTGQYCIVGYEDNVFYTQVFSRDFTKTVTLPDGSGGHGDAAITGDGRDVYVYQNIRTDYISFADMETGVETPLLPIPFNINPDIGLHISGNASKTPGWVLVSTYNSYNPPAGKTHSWMDNQLFMLELKANPRVWRLAHTHSYISLDPGGEKNYFAEAFATINTNGTRIYWGSNWCNYSADYTDTYMLTLPKNWIFNIP